MADMLQEEIHQALEALYDNVTLAGCALVQRFPEVAALPDPVERAMRLRAIVLEAIEILRPLRHAAFGSLESRSCDVLTLRYLEKLDMAAMINELSLGRRQVFRDLRQAEERLATILGAWAGKPETAGRAEQAPDTLSSELAMLASQPVQVQLEGVMREAVGLVGPLAQAFGVKLSCRYPGERDLVTADRAILKQVLVQLLSWAIKHAQPSELKMATTSDERLACLSLLFRPAGDDEGKGVIAEIERIAASQRIGLELHRSHDAYDVRVAIRRQQQPATVLVVEDNPGAVELYRRYLSGGGWQVLHAAEPRLTLDIARRSRPDAIVLDVMMPKMDGWSVLQALKQHEETRAIPVIICSVVEDRELSQTLGARASLKKPVSQGDFLAALHQCLLGRAGRFRLPG